MMKLYEKMGIDLNTQEGVESLFGISCEDIPDKIGTNPKCPFPQEDCDRCRAERLFAEVPTKKVPRIETIHTAEELENAGKVFEETICYRCNCNGCRYNEPATNTYECFIRYLSEEVEVEV